MAYIVEASLIDPAGIPIVQRIVNEPVKRGDIFGFIRIPETQLAAIPPELKKALIDLKVAELVSALYTQFGVE